jgi:mono/diheme cytochrome c family protein
MSNTEMGRRQKAEGRRQSRLAWPSLCAAFASRRAAFCLLLSAFCLLASGCRMDMQDQPKYKNFRAGDQKFGVNGASVRAPVEGTVPRQFGEYRDREDYFYTGKTAGQAGGQATTPASSQAATGANALGNTGANVPGTQTAGATGGPDIFPITIDAAALERGRQRFNIYCIVCHGATGEGDGMVVRRGYRKPPSYYEDKLQEGTASAAHFFDVITNGWGAMPDYASQIAPEDRWKIIAYIRTLQLSRKLKMQDLSPDEQRMVVSAAQKPPAGEGGGGGPEQQSQGEGGAPSKVEGGNH